MSEMGSTPHQESGVTAPVVTSDIAPKGHRHHSDRLHHAATWLAILILAGLLVFVALVGYTFYGMLFRETASVEQRPAPIARLNAQVVSDPQDIVARMKLASEYRAAGQLYGALDEYERILRDNPNDTDALYEKGAVLLALGRRAEAESLFWEVLDKEPLHAQAAEALGEYYASRGMYRSLIRAVRPVVTRRPDEVRLQYLMGLAYENLGHKVWAEARYKLALEGAPDMQDALDGLKRLSALGQQ